MRKRTYTLVKLAIAAPGHGWVVSPVDLGNVVTFDVGHLVHGQVAGKRNLHHCQGVYFVLVQAFHTEIKSQFKCYLGKKRATK